MVVWKAGEDWALLTKGVYVILVESVIINEIDAWVDEEDISAQEIHEQLEALFNNDPKRPLSEYEAVLS